jgi:hypothetical protein
MHAKLLIAAVVASLAAASAIADSTGNFNDYTSAAIGSNDVSRADVLAESAAYKKAHPKSTRPYDYPTEFVAAKTRTEVVATITRDPANSYVSSEFIETTAMSNGGRNAVGVETVKTAAK